jgi:hypothetical protein
MEPMNTPLEALVTSWSRAHRGTLEFEGALAYGSRMSEHRGAQQRVTGEPSHVPSGAALLALELSEIARGIRGLDVLRRSVDRAPPSCN